MSTPTGTSTGCRHYISLWTKKKKKMETPEAIRTSLQQGEWVTSIVFKDVYFHIPIQEQSRKYLISCPGSDIPIQSSAFQSVHSTLGVHCNSKEVKLMAIHKDIRIHQYLDDWLVRARPHQVCLQHTQELVKICQELGWLVNLEKSELEPRQIFVFCRLPVRPQGRSGPSDTRPLAEPSGQKTGNTVTTGLSSPAVLISDRLLTATEKQVHLGRLHIRPIRWHLKTTGGY